jgi:hypothetical protein
MQNSFNFINIQEQLFNAFIICYTSGIPKIISSYTFSEDYTPRPNFSPNNPKYQTLNPQYEVNAWRSQHLWSSIIGAISWRKTLQISSKKPLHKDDLIMVSDHCLLIMRKIENKSGFAIFNTDAYHICTIGLDILSNLQMPAGNYLNIGKHSIDNFEKGMFLETFPPKQSISVEPEGVYIIHSGYKA